jgi:excisionase family DNA binding protein
METEAQPPVLLTIEETAKELRLKASTIRSWILGRKIEFLKLGSRVFISRSVLCDLLAASVVPAQESTVTQRRRRKMTKTKEGAA